MPYHINLSVGQLTIKTNAVTILLQGNKDHLTQFHATLHFPRQYFVPCIVSHLLFKGIVPPKWKWCHPHTN